MKIRKKFSALFLLIGLVFLMNICAYADEEKTIVDSIGLTITSNITPGDQIKGSENSISVETDTEGIDVSIEDISRHNKKSVTAWSMGARVDENTWRSSDYPEFVVCITTKEGYSLDTNKVRATTVNGKKIDDFYQIDSGNVKFKYELPRIDGLDNNHKFDLTVTNVHIDPETLVTTWDASEDAHLFQVRLFWADNNNQCESGYVIGDTQVDFSYLLKSGIQGESIYATVCPAYDSVTLGKEERSNTITVAGVKPYQRQYSNNTETYSDSSYNDTYDNDSYDDTYDDNSFSDINFTSNEDTVNETEVTNNSTETPKIQGTVNGKVIEGEWLPVHLDTGEDKWWFFETDRTANTNLFNVWFYIPATAQWYRFDDRSFVVTGLKEIDGALYYFEEQPENQGAMYANKSYGGYFFGPDGKAVIAQ